MTTKLPGRERVNNIQNPIPAKANSRWPHCTAIKSVSKIQNHIPAKANSRWPHCTIIKFKELKEAIHNPSLRNMCFLQSKIAKKNTEEKGRAIKPPNFLDWKNMTLNTKMAKAVKRVKKKPAKEGSFPLDAADEDSLLKTRIGEYFLVRFIRSLLSQLCM